MEKFLAGGYWKLSWTMKNGKRVRLVHFQGHIEVTYDDLRERKYESKDATDIRELLESC